MGELISRRRAARLMGLGALATFLPGAASRLLAGSQSLLLRAIPKTGEKLPVIGLGSAKKPTTPSVPAQAALAAPHGHGGH